MNTPKMKKLFPRGNDGIIEVRGRTERWMGFNWNKQSFIALPACHHPAKLIVVHCHEELGHRGIAATISQVWSKYWVIGVRRLARQIIGRCTSCKRKNKIKSEQVTSSFPVERLKPSPPFAYTGIDFLGGTKADPSKVLWSYFFVYGHAGYLWT